MQHAPNPNRGFHPHFLFNKGARVFSTCTCSLIHPNRDAAHVKQFNYPHIDSTTGWLGALAVISLQGLRRAFEINGGTLLFADSRPTYSILYPPPPSITLLLLFMNGLCLPFPNCQLRHGDDTDARQQEAGGCSGGKPDVKTSDLQGNPTHSLKPALNQKCQYLSQIYSLKPAGGKLGGPFLMAIHHQWARPASFMYFYCSIPFCLPRLKEGEAPLLGLDEILLQKLLAPYTMAL